MKHLFLALFLSFSAFSPAVMAQHKELAGGPKNSASIIKEGEDSKSLILIYNDQPIFDSHFDHKPKISSYTNGDQIIEQYINFEFNQETTINAVVYGSPEALAAETRGPAQENFALVRTSHGLSNNRRNNAIYDRNLDWMLEMPEGTIIKSFREIDGTTRFELTFTTTKGALIFRPRYYQKHKNLPYFQPWTYQVNKESITGWSSWWAYFREFTEQDNRDLLDIWQKKHFADYGYRFVQIDDVYQGENDKDRKNCDLASGYYGGRPTTWLDWKKDIFPGGMTGYVDDVNKAGFSSAIWIGCFFSDEETVQKHPDWFVSDEAGYPVSAPWVSYVIDATNQEAVDALIRPIFKGIKNAGVEYVKIDQLRHYLYDLLHNNLKWCEEKNIGPDELLRAYLRIAREELGDDTFILACWGVLPETIGIADACRIGGDGYGPVTMQQYNSWNGIVWRNDPDHCDVSPIKKGRGVGNVKMTESRQAIPKESIIRPALASIAGAMLILSDKPEVYENDQNLYGLRRSSPVLFTVPGQLYDFDPQKTNWLKEHQRTEINTGKRPSPIDGDQMGEVSHFWLNEFNMSFENWNVLHRLNWSKKKKSSLPTTNIMFADLGLDPAKEYLVYEFWTHTFLGVLKNELKLGKLGAYGIESFAIREKLNRPQLVSTNRHISQGAAELEKLIWEDNTIKGRSKMIVEDNYTITVFVPENYQLKSAWVDGKEVKATQEDHLLRMSYLPKQTASLSWKISFTEK